VLFFTKKNKLKLEKWQQEVIREDVDRYIESVEKKYLKYWKKDDSK